MLEERKKIILKALIDDYIETGMPVSSHDIVDKLHMNLSSATIRNELNELEQMGYLKKPHTSAGRVPSNSGYRMYVDHLMMRYCLTTAELHYLKESMETRLSELDRIMKRVSKIASDFNHLTAVIVAPDMKKGNIKKVEVTQVDDHKILIIIITDTDMVKNRMFHTNRKLSNDEVILIKTVLNTHLSGHPIEEADNMNIEQFISMIDVGHEAVKNILSFIDEAIRDSMGEEIYLVGTGNIFGAREFSDIGKLKEVFDFLSEDKSVYKMVKNHSQGESVKIIIGNELNTGGISDLSLVVSTYNVGPVKGAMGLIGHKRMDYSKAVASLEYITEGLNKMLNE